MKIKKNICVAKDAPLHILIINPIIKGLGDLIKNRFSFLAKVHFGPDDEKDNL